jgi:hypothetical protein
MLQICPKVLGMKQLSSSSEHDINKKEDLENFKTEQTHFFSP